MTDQELLTETLRKYKYEPQNGVFTWRNCCPQRTNNSSGVSGVYRHTKNQNWVAKITHNYRQIHIGSFTSIFEAAAARIAAGKALFTHQETL